jgi:hypothetical protein
MPARDRVALAREAYRAHESGDRRVLDELMSEDFKFFSAAEVGIDRARCFERCWPNAGRIEEYGFPRLLEAGDEVIVTYECTRTDGSSFRNTEVLAFEGEKIRKTEVSFGRDLA